MLRVLVIDGHVQFAELVGAALGEEPDLESVGYATNVAQGLDLIETVAPDVVAVNVHIGPGDGIAAMAKIHDLHPSVRVVVLTAFASEPMMQRAIKANARGFHPKDAGPARLLWVLRNTRDEGFTVHPEVLHRLISGGPLSSPRSASTSLPSPRAPLGDGAVGAIRFVGSRGC